MKLIETISRAPVVAMLGMCKNAGKTTAMNTLIRDFPERSVLCVTSIGRDGESRDLVTGTDKPAVWIREGMLAATASDLLPLCGVSREILCATEIYTSLGEVIIFRARSDGFVQLAGPAIIDQLGELRKKLEPFGPECILIDGALSRKSPLSAAADGVCILSTGASLDPDMDTVVSETAFAAGLLCLPAFPRAGDVDPQNRKTGRIRILHEDETSDYADSPADIKALSETDCIIFPGALTETQAQALLRSRAVKAGITVAARDPSCLMLKRETWQSLTARGILFAVRDPAHLAAVTINPSSPEGRIFDPDLFLEKMRKAVSVPVLDVMHASEED